MSRKITTKNGAIFIITVLALIALCLIGSVVAEEQTNVTTTLVIDDSDSTILKNENNLPSSYDLRDYGYVTPVRNQTPFGICWAFGIMGAIESNILKKGLVPIEDADKLDLSEAQLVYYIMNRDGVTKGEALPGFENSLDTYVQIGDINTFLIRGANPIEMVNQLSAGIGIATEENDKLKYNYFVENISEDMKLSPELAVSENKYYPQNIYFVSINDRNLVKQLLMEKGAATVGYLVDPTASNFIKYSGYEDENGNKILTHNSSYDHSYQSAGYMNHLVTLIGWDDNYPKENFARYAKAKDGTITEVELPEHDGAWLIKNSWGTEATYTEPDGTEKTWDGYMWISYDDKTIGNSLTINSDIADRSVIFYDVVPSGEYYDTIYQYDTGLSIIGVPYSKKYNPGDIQKVSAKNVYTAEGTEVITAVEFRSSNPNIEYTITILVNDETKATISGKEAYVGYHTVHLSDPILIHEGDLITVILDLSMVTTDKKEQLTIATDATMYSSQLDANYITQTDVPGRSYIRDAYSLKQKDYTDEDVDNELANQGITREIAVSLGLNLEKLKESLSFDYGKIADENGWIDITSLPSFSLYNSAQLSDKKMEQVKLKYGSARIKLFTVDVDEGTIIGNSSVDAGKTLALKVATSDNSPVGIDWTTSNAAVATVDAEGNVHAVKEGTVTITATNKVTGKTSTKTITVVKAAKPVTEKNETAKSPFPVLGILTGLGITGILAIKRRR